MLWSILFHKEGESLERNIPISMANRRHSFGFMATDTAGRVSGQRVLAPSGTGKGEARAMCEQGWRCHGTPTCLT